MSGKDGREPSQEAGDRRGAFAAFVDERGPYPRVVSEQERRGKVRWGRRLEDTGQMRC